MMSRSRKTGAVPALPKPIFEIREVNEPRYVVTSDGNEEERFETLTEARKRALELVVEAMIEKAADEYNDRYNFDFSGYDGTPVDTIARWVADHLDQLINERTKIELVTP
jgi:hypothetical protein